MTNGGCSFIPQAHTVVRQCNQEIKDVEQCWGDFTFRQDVRTSSQSIVFLGHVYTWWIQVVESECSKYAASMRKTDKDSEEYVSGGYCARLCVVDTVQQNEEMMKYLTCHGTVLCTFCLCKEPLLIQFPGPLQSKLYDVCLQDPKNTDFKSNTSCSSCACWLSYSAEACQKETRDLANCQFIQVWAHLSTSTH